MGVVPVGAAAVRVAMIAQRVKVGSFILSVVLSVVLWRGVDQDGSEVEVKKAYPKTEK